MNRNLFFMEMRRNLGTLVIWAFLIGVLIAFTMALYPTFIKNQKPILGFITMVPGAILKFRGISNLSDIFSVLGYYSANNIVYMMLIGSIYSIVLSSNILIKEEYNRTAEFLLSKPLTRREIILTKWAVSVVNIILLNIFTVTVGYFSILLVKTGDFAFSSFLLLAFYTFLLNILFGALGLFIPTMISRPRQVTSMSVGIVILFYFIYTISKITESAGKFGYISPFKFVNVEVLSPVYRIGFWNLFYFIGLSVILTLAAIIKYQRKDIYT